jgi:hypothetical protein
MFSDRTLGRGASAGRAATGFALAPPLLLPYPLRRFGKAGVAQEKVFEKQAAIQGCSHWALYCIAFRLNAKSLRVSVACARRWSSAPAPESSVAAGPRWPASGRTATSAPSRARFSGAGRFSALTTLSRLAAAASGSRPSPRDTCGEQRIEQRAFAAAGEFERQQRRAAGQRQPVFGVANAGVAAAIAPHGASAGRRTGID